MPGAASATGQHARIHAARDQYMLRPLPGEDLYSHFKKIDNSRLVREPDPQARGACWSAIGATALGVMLLTGVLAPRVANTLAGYKLEALRNENRRLLDERRALDLQEAELTAPERLQELARRRNMVVPNSGQVVPLNAVPSGPGDSSVAMNH
jgi:cell division protein FtsL